jgi:hypothetical protein
MGAHRLAGEARPIWRLGFPYVDLGTPCPPIWHFAQAVRAKRTTRQIRYNSAHRGQLLVRASAHCFIVTNARFKECIRIGRANEAGGSELGDDTRRGRIRAAPTAVWRIGSFAMWQEGSRTYDSIVPTLDLCIILLRCEVSLETRRADTKYQDQDCPS